MRGETVRRQTIRLAERLVMFHPLTAGCMVAGDSSTALRSARNDRGGRGQTVRHQTIDDRGRDLRLGFRTYPQSFAQLLPREGACVTYYTVRQ